MLLYWGAHSALLALLSRESHCHPWVLAGHSLVVSGSLDLPTVYPKLRLQDWPLLLWVSAYIISQHLLVSGCQPTGAISDYQPASSAYTHLLLSSCLHNWNTTALLKVNMQENVRKIDEPQQNNKRRVIGENDETVNYIIKKFSKPVQKLTSRGSTGWARRSTAQEIKVC